MSTTPSEPPPAVPVRYAQEATPQTGVARRTSPLTVGIEVVGLTAALLMDLLDQWTGPSDGWELSFAVVPLLFLGPRIVGWWFRTYTLTETHIELDEGILQRRHRVVPLNRVQQVDLHQNVLAQIFRLAALHIETAGEGGAGAVSLSLLRLDDAEALRQFVLARRDAQAAAGAAPPAPTLPYELARMTPGQLLAAGFTQSPGLVLSTALVAGVPWLVGYAAHDEPVLVVAACISVVSVLVVVAVLRAVGVVVGQWNWTLTSRGDDLHLRAGWLQVREQSVPRQRIQHLSVVDNPLRRVLGLTSIILHTAVPAGSPDGVSTLVEVPIVRRVDVDALLRHVMGPDWVLPSLHPRSATAGRRALVRRTLMLVPGCVGPGLVWQGAAWLVAPLLLVAVPWGRAAHRRAGHAVTTHLVALASGVVHHRVDLVPLTRIQSARSRTSPLQRRQRLATFHVDVAGSTRVGPSIRSPRLFDMDADETEHLRRSLPTPNPARPR